MSRPNAHLEDFQSAAVGRLRADLALAPRAAAHHGLAEGPHHFSIELPDGSGRFLLNSRGLLCSETGADDIVMIDVQGHKPAGSPSAWRGRRWASGCSRSCSSRR